MKNVLRLAALVAVLVVTAFSIAIPAYAAAMDCAVKDGAACSNPGATSRCVVYDDGSQCSYWYPCWCERNYLGSYSFRCGSSHIYESCPI